MHGAAKGTVGTVGTVGIVMRHNAKVIQISSHQRGALNLRAGCLGIAGSAPMIVDTRPM